LTGGGSNLKHLRQLANYTTGFDSRIGFANEYMANDKNQYLKGPEFATSIGLLMESLKIRDKKLNTVEDTPVLEKSSRKMLLHKLRLKLTTCSAEVARYRNNSLKKNSMRIKRRQTHFRAVAYGKSKKIL
jgi:cell division ATPase FtsA